MLVAASAPDDVGPIVINGSPMSYWAGTVGENPMRYVGGLRGGAAPALLMSDLGAGIFDGSALVMNFANIGMMGHQIGIDVHEIPWLHNTTPEVFQPGMVMCIEPKLWLPGEAFMRTEDMVLITETGCESLTVFDRNCYELPLE